MIPAGARTVAELIMSVVVVLDIVAVTVYVVVEPAGMLTVSLILPEPLAVHIAPEPAAHVQIALVSEEGMVSRIKAPFALLGPALLTTIV